MNQYQTDILTEVVNDLKLKADRVLMQAKAIQQESDSLRYEDRENARELAALLSGLSSKLLTDSYSLGRLVKAHGVSHA